MPTNRTFLLACATVATLGLSAASSTPADARPCREALCSVRSAIEGAMQAAMAKQMQAQAGAMKAAMAKKMQAAMVAKQAEMEKQMQAAMVAKQAEMEKQMKAAAAAKQAEMEAAAGASMVPTENPTALPSSLSEGKGKGQELSAAPVAATPCLTKEYLNGRAMFRNNCTGEWVQRSD